MSTIDNVADTNDPGVTPNAKRLLWAGFMAILAAGVGFSVRGGILGQWAEQFGFTMTELVTITGGGLTGFGLVIIFTSLFADRIGYGKLMISAFVLHFISAVLTLATPAFFASGGKDAAYWCLFIAMFIFAVGNGVCEAVVNPLVATLFPRDKTHYLNILHAGWPAGLVLGGLASYFMAGGNGAQAVDWKIQMSLFLIPVIIYGVMLLGQRFPRSEVATAGVTIGQMLRSVMVPLFIVLLILHALVGYVELGTDSWISKITGNILNSPASGLGLFVYTSTLMFALRFVAGPIVERISPLGLLFVSSIFGFIGLLLLSNAVGVVACIVAVTVYALGKTFLWPTMLAVASERFPNGGAVAIGLMGGVGMLSAGLLGGPGIGFKQDFHASSQLRTADAAVYERYKAPNENSFLGFKTVGLDGAKVGVLGDEGKEANRALEVLKKDTNIKPEALAVQQGLVDWWAGAKTTMAEDKPKVDGATLHGSRMALKLTAYVPMVMALLYLGLLLYFKSTGGYKALHVSGEKETGGVAGPHQA